MMTIGIPTTQHNNKTRDDNVKFVVFLSMLSGVFHFRFAAGFSVTLVCCLKCNIF